jgi:hypothetical protein
MRFIGHIKTLRRPRNKAVNKGNPEHIKTYYKRPHRQQTQQTAPKNLTSTTYIFGIIKIVNIKPKKENLTTK